MWTSVEPSLGVIGYAACAVAYAVLLVVLAIGWRGRTLPGVLLVVAASVSLVWAVMLAWQGSREVPEQSILRIIEVLRDAAWVGFFWGVMRRGPNSRGGTHARSVAFVAIAAFFLAVVELVLALLRDDLVNPLVRFDLPNISKLGLILAVLLLVEHLYRSTSPQRRWGIKYLCLAIVGVYLFDFYKYSEALLFRSDAVALWHARGFINTLVVPLIAVAAARNPSWRLDVYVSRSVVFQSATLTLAGIYLIVVAGAGYYLRRYGGDWGRVSQVVLLFSALIVLSAVVLSSGARAKLRVLVSKHFFNYRYDYRTEWLRITHTLADSTLTENVFKRAMRAIAAIVDSPRGQLWVRQSDGRLALGYHGTPDDSLEIGSAVDEALTQFVVETGWIVDTNELNRYPERYQGLNLPEGWSPPSWVWLIVPLRRDHDLVGIVFLGQSLAKRELNWEDRDLLKVAADQVAGFLMQHETMRVLAEARQFEGFNRLASYVMHDLKNLVAQLSLVVANAKRHGSNPEFLRDAIGTVESAVNRMNRLMQQLRSGDLPRLTEEIVDLGELVARAVEQRFAGGLPPKLETTGEALPIRGNPARLLAVISNYLQNAQEATPADGDIGIRVWREGEKGHIEIVDTGCGMSEEFVRERLFRPFDSTKGLTGMGIGAYEGRELFRALGGEVTVWSQPGRGTRLRMTAPLSISKSEK